eukprot:6566742-Pyramimonas_sp.AAC.1
MTTDRKKWQTEVIRRCNRKHHGPNETTAHQLQRIHRRRLRQQEAHLGGNPPPNLDFGTTMAARSRLKPGKAPGRG